MYRLLISSKAVKYLSKLDSKSYKIISRSINKLVNFENISNLDIKLLKGKYENMYRLRIGSRRVLFTVKKIKKEIKIWVIGNRGDVYLK